MMQLLKLLLTVPLLFGGAGCSEGSAEAFRGLVGTRHQTAYRAAVYNSSPTSWWFADQPSGNLRDYSIAASNAAVPVGGINYGIATLVVGESTAVNSNGPGIYFTLTSDVVLTGDFTFAWWYKGNSPAGFNPFWSQSTADHPEVYYFQNKMQVRDTNNAVCADSNSFNDTNQHFVVVTRIGTACKIYNNGSDVTNTSNAWTGSLTFTVHQILHETGSGNAAANWQHGAIYNGRGLSGSDVTTLWNAGH